VFWLEKLLITGTWKNDAPPAFSARSSTGPPLAFRTSGTPGNGGRCNGSFAWLPTPGAVLGVFRAFVCSGDRHVGDERRRQSRRMANARRSALQYADVRDHNIPVVTGCLKSLSDVCSSVNNRLRTTRGQGGEHQDDTATVWRFRFTYGHNMRITTSRRFVYTVQSFASSNLDGLEMEHVSLR
jgi:hypothetical protein